MPTYRLVDKKSGKEYKYRGEKPPSKLEAKQYIWERENTLTGKVKQKAGDLYESASKPLTDLPSRIARKLGSENPNFQVGLDDSKPLAMAKGFYSGAIDAGGDLLSSFSSPLSLGTTALTLGAGGAARAGLAGGSRALTLGARAASVPAIAHGAYKIGTAEDLGEVGAGALELGAGAVGLGTPFPKGKTSPSPRLRLKGKTAPKETPKKGPFRAGPSVMEGEFEEVFPPKALPSADRKRLGTGDRVFESGPAREEPLQDILEQNTPYGMNYLRRGGEATESPMSSPVLDDFEPASPPPPKAKVDLKTRPYQKARDQDVGFLAEQGDVDAIAEAKMRPGLWDSMKAFSKSNPKLAKLFSSEKGELKVGPFQKGVDEAAESTPKFEGEERRVMDFGPKSGAKDRRPPPMKQPMPSERRMSELLKKLGGTKLASDETGSINLGAGKAPKNPFNPAKGTPYEEKFSQWVNNVRSSKVEGILRGKEFKDLDELGIEGIHAFQSGSRTGQLKKVGEYFDNKFRQLKKEGVPLNYRENYVPQIWADEPGKVNEVYRRLGLKPGFTLDRVFENYANGISAGLTPKFKNISELVQWYEQKANKAIYDRQFYEMGKELGWLKPKGKGGPDWKDLDSNHFPAVTIRKKGTSEVRTMPMTAPPELHEMMTNYTAEPNKVMDWMANMSSLSKNFAMSAGVPGTAINAHGFNILARTIKGNPKQALKAGYYLINPRAAKRALDEALPTAPWAVKQGLTLTTEGYELGQGGSSNLVKEGPVQKFLKVQGKLFEDPLFQNMIPALKIKHFNDMVADLTKSGTQLDEAGKIASDFTNNLYGGINWEAMGRSRDLQNLARMVVLAPDWMETNVRMGAGMAKTLLNPKSPQGRYYARAARNLIGSYIAANVVNYALNGRHMWENEPGHALDIDLGQSGEKERWLRPWGTGADYLRLPFDMASAALRTKQSGKWEPDFGSASNIVKNRLSIPLSTGVNLLTKRDDFGRPFLGRDDYGNMIPPGKQIGGTVSELGDLVAPPYVRSMTDYATGRANAEQAALGAIESPIRYSSRRKQTGGRGARTRGSRSR